MAAQPMWSVATPPTAYGDVEDERRCRHVRVPRRPASLDELKRAILHAYEDQYQPSEVTLFFRIYDDEPKVVRDRGVDKALGYEPDWLDLAPHGDDDNGTVLLIVSAMDEAESNLLIMPASFSASRSALLRHARAASNGSVSSAQPLLRTLIDAEPSLFDPLPLPAHVDDWLAQVREAPQSVDDLLSSERAVPAPGRRTICIQPLVLPARAPRVAAFETRLFDGILGFIAAFFHKTPVRMLPEIELDIDKRKRKTQLLGRTIQWRDVCPANDEALPWGQINACQTLLALKPRPLRGGSGSTKSKGGGGGRATHYGGVLPDDGFCVLGVTMIDLFCADDDVFTGGLADIQSRAGVFSFHRYIQGRTGGSSGAAAADSSVPLFRACKTAAHEILHNFGIGHCVHRSCLMNGCGHLAEDFAAPPYLCPVDLAKLLAVLGGSCELIPRYEALLDFCTANGAGFGEYATWLRRALDTARKDGKAGFAAAASLPSKAGAACKSGKRPVSETMKTTSTHQQTPGPAQDARGGARGRAVAAGDDNEDEDDEDGEDDDMAPLHKRLAARRM
jgi:hypothetical protein